MWAIISSMWGNWPNAIATEYGSFAAISDIIDNACLTATGSENSILQLYQVKWEENEYETVCLYI
jgi:hypothetical protein